VENVEFAILRESLRGGVMGWSGFDPRRSADEIARSLDLSPNTVRRHLAGWRRTGFLVGFYVMPNPATLGMKSNWSMLQFSDRIHVAHALSNLQLIDGIIWAFEAPDQLHVHYAAETDGSLDRKARLMSQIPGVTRVETSVTVVPPCDHRMSRLDWRIVQVLRNSPEIPLATMAARLGISLKTARKRFDTLVEKHAICFFPELGISQFHGTVKVFFAILQDPARSEELARKMEGRFPNAIRAYGPGCAAPGDPSPVVTFMVAATSDAQLDEASGEIRVLPGVLATALTAPNRFTRYTVWTDEQINSRLNGLTASQAKGRGRRNEEANS
jgi:DNA-binding Lrp family transcriptional regulator